MSQISRRHGRNGTPVEGSGMGGHGHKRPGIRECLPGCGAGGATIHIGYMVDVSINQEDTSRISLPCDRRTYRVAAKMASE